MPASSSNAAISGRKRIKANIWLAAHECMVHEMPKAFGKVGRVMIDESPLDAFMFGVDNSDEVTLRLDALRTPPREEFAGRDAADGRARGRCTTR